MATDNSDSTDGGAARKGARIALPLAGGCQCGAVRYRVTGRPLGFHICHCRDCQRQSASAFGESLQIRAADLQMTGDTRLWRRPTDSGGISEGLFCPACGIRLLHRRPGGDVCNLKAGTLDDTGWLEPAAHMWTDRRQPWVRLDGPALRFARQPPDMAAVQAHWQAMMRDRFSPPD